MHTDDGPSPADADGSTAPNEPLARDEFVRSETRRLRRIAKELIPGEGDRDDLVQDVWVEALERPPRERGRMSAWLRVVTDHAARRFWRKSRSRQARERIAAKPERVPSVLDALEREAATAELRRWVGALPPPYREVLELHFFEGAAPAAIAKALHRPPGTVRSQLKRGLEQLRARYRKASDADRDDAARAAWPWLAAPLAESQDGAARVLRPAAIVAGVLVIGGAILWLARGAPDARLALESPALLSPEPRPSPHERIALPPSGAPDDARRQAVEERVPAASIEGSASSTSIPADPIPVVEYVVTGRTLDIFGKPVADADVWAAPADDPFAAALVARSDSAGRYSIADLAQDAWVWAEEIDSGLTARCYVYHPGERETVRRDLAFQANLGRMSGTVRDARGTPVAGAQVLASIVRPTLGKRGPEGRSDAVYRGGPRSTDERGRFEITRIHAPRVRILVTAPLEAPFVAQVEGLCKERIEIALPAPADLAGTLLGPDGAPAARIDIVLEHPEPLPAARATTDDAGTFRFALVPPGRFTLSAAGDGDAGGPSWVEQGVLAPGESRRIAGARLSKSWTIVGEARTGDRPLAGWTVTLEDESTGSEGLGRRTITTDEGRFAFGACAGESCALSLRPPESGRGTPRARVRGVRPGGPSVVLAFDDRTGSPSSLRGTFVDAPVPPGNVATVLATRVAEAPEDRLEFEAVVDRRTGTFEFHGLPPGDFRVVARHPVLGDWDLAEALPLDPGSSIDLGRLAPPPRGTLVVHWTQAFGSGEENFSFSLEGRGFVITGRRGRPDSRMRVDEAAHTVRVPDLLPGTYALQIQGATVAIERRTVRIAENASSEVEIVLREGAPAQIRVPGPRRLAQDESVTVRIHTPTGPIEMPMTDENIVNDLDTLVRFRVTLPQGSNRIEVTTSGGLRGERVLEAKGHTPFSVVEIPIR